MINILRSLYWRFLKSPQQQARHLGVNIGKDCLIATRRWSSEPYLITIGNHVQVTEGVWFHTHGGGNSIRAEVPDYDSFGKIIIKDWAYIGSGSHILPGVTIGEGALVAAGSIVTKSVPPYTVVGGNPARVICTIEDYKRKNIKYNTKTYGMSVEEKKRILLNLPEDMFIKK